MTDNKMLVESVFGVTTETVVFCLKSRKIFECIPAFIMANYGKWVKDS